ncbi:MAG: hypothetical protein N2578_10395 [Bdellovibrionaceae bacterium]|nr:hypothetical protein [Pseudobdellovibrionaceae bacterium]
MCRLVGKPRSSFYYKTQAVPQGKDKKRKERAMSALHDLSNFLRQRHLRSVFHCHKRTDSKLDKDDPQLFILSRDYSVSELDAFRSARRYLKLSEKEKFEQALKEHREANCDMIDDAIEFSEDLLELIFFYISGAHSAIRDALSKVQKFL